jgi:hypothetical protein
VEMITKRIVVWLVIFVVAVLVVYEFSRLSSASEIKGGFKETAFIRNENNLGSVLLFYAVSVSDTLNAHYKAFGNLMPHNKHSGVTTVYFFDISKPVPDKLSLDFPHFDTARFHPVARYIKDKTGTSKVVKM